MNIMVNSNDYKDTITKLKFIGKIQSGEKINTKYYMAIVNNDWWTSVLRTFYNFESRGCTLNFLNETIRNALVLIEDIKKKPDLDEDQTMLHHIYINLAQAIDGIENLKKTYSNDKIVVASLETIIEQVELHFKMNKVVIKSPLQEYDGQ